ncbi:WD40 repeat domain-containing protein [Marinactinospora rubrisoli]|uniref:WD40 repeat domain-containing protein n=1 Tax=Marinactinospora rubrisoli TaxID=2715399 RepID=A0ABW2KDI4_9ACTN
MAFTPDGAGLIATDEEGAVHFFDAATGEPRNTVRVGSPDDVALSGQLALHPDGTTVAAVVGTEIRLLDAATGAERGRLDQEGRPPWAMAFTPDGERLVGGGTDQVVNVIDAATGDRIAALIGHTDTVVDIALTPDGTMAATIAADETVRLWDLTAGRQVAALDVPGASGRIAFDAAGTRLAVGYFDGSLRLWSLPDDA